MSHLRLGGPGEGPPDCRRNPDRIQAETSRTGAQVMAGRVEAGVPLEVLPQGFGATSYLQVVYEAFFEILRGKNLLAVLFLFNLRCRSQSATLHEDKGGRRVYEVGVTF